MYNSPPPPVSLYVISLLIHRLHEIPWFTYVFSIKGETILPYETPRWLCIFTFSTYMFIEQLKSAKGNVIMTVDFKRCWWLLLTQGVVVSIASSSYGRTCNDAPC